MKGCGVTLALSQVCAHPRCDGTVLRILGLGIFAGPSACMSGTFRCSGSGYLTRKTP